MILDDRAEKILYEVFPLILEYSISRKIESWEKINSFETDNHIVNKKFIRYLDDELYSHFDRMLGSFDSELVKIYAKEMCIQIKEDGKPEVSSWQILDKDKIKEVFLSLYRRYQKYDSLPVIKRLLLIRHCLETIINQRPDITVRKEVVEDEYVPPRYLIQCFADDTLLPIQEDVVKAPYYECFNQIKRKIEQIITCHKQRIFDGLVMTATNALSKKDPDAFTKEFINKIIKENYSRYRSYYDSITKLVFNFLGNLMQKVKENEESENYSFIARDLLFRWLLSRSLVYEIYVFRKLVNMGIPCMFRLELDRNAELDLVYCTKSGLGAVEVKSSRFDYSIVEKIDLFKDYEIKKFVIICPSGVKSEEQTISKHGQVEILSFEELSDGAKLFQLVKDL